MKRQTKHNNFKAKLCVLLFFVACFTTCFSRVYLSTASISLSRSIQDKEERIKELAESNLKLEREIDRMGSKEYITGVASENGMTINLDNVIQIR